MIELRQLRYLLAAAEAGSFSRAAIRIGIKQSTLSRQILFLEHRLGMKVFERVTRGAVLTHNGQIYLRTAKRIVQEFEELNDWVRSIQQGEAGRLSIGFYTSFSAGNLRATLTEYGDRFPDVKIQSFERDRDALLSGLESGLLDIVIMVGEVRYPGFKNRALWSERILVALPEGHVLADREQIDWWDLARERFLLTVHDPGPETRNLLLGKLGRPGYAPTIEMEDIKRDTVLSRVALGKHVSIVSESALGLQICGVVFRELHEERGHARIGYSGYWRPDNDSTALRRFLDFVSARYSLPPA
jgi:DNA-binding transcriptional LysR family regulator